MSDALPSELEILHRTSQQPSRYCDTCNAWTDHFTTEHADTDEVADPDFVADLLAQARQSIQGKKEKP